MLFGALPGTFLRTFQARRLARVTIVLNDVPRACEHACYKTCEKPRRRRLAVDPYPVRGCSRRARRVEAVPGKMTGNSLTNVQRVNRESDHRLPICADDVSFRREVQLDAVTAV